MNRRELLGAAGFAFLGARTTVHGAQHRRFRPAICAYSYREALGKKSMTYDDLVRLAVDLDVDGLDLTVYWFPNTSDSFLLPLRRLAYKSGVEIYSLSVRTDMCQPTRELQEAEAKNVRQWVDVAEKLGAGHIRVFGGDVPKTATEAQAAQWVVEVLKRASEYSATKGVILGLENHGGITERADRVVQIVRAIDSPWVGINLDTGNFNRDGYPQIEKCAPYAVNVQLKTEIKDVDGNDQPADWKRVLQILGGAGYKGYVALEFEGKDNPSSAVPKLIARLRQEIHSS